MKRVYANEAVCAGCRLCEIWCVVAHSRTKDIIRAFNDEFPRPLPRVRVEETGPVSFALQCRHCVDPPCVEACMTGAMHRLTPEGPVLHDAEKCVGCWMCIMVCPYGAIQRNETSKKVASKCDLCQDEDEPSCVAHCPNEALVFEDRGE